MSEKIEKIEKIEKSKHRDRGGVGLRPGNDLTRCWWLATPSGGPPRRPGRVGSRSWRRRTGSKRPPRLLKAAVQWRNEAQQYATDHGKPPMDRPAQGPWRMEAAEAEDHVRVRFLRAAHNYVWAKALGWDAKASGGRLLNAALRLPSATETEEA